MENHRLSAGHANHLRRKTDSVSDGKRETLPQGVKSPRLHWALLAPKYEKDLTDVQLVFLEESNQGTVAFLNLSVVGSVAGILSFLQGVLEGGGISPMERLIRVRPY